jgi:hypothetical protein
MALARLALAVPFVLLLLQMRRPDSPEMLALRLQQEMNKVFTATLPRQ